MYIYIYIYVLLSEERRIIGAYRVISEAPESTLRDYFDFKGAQPCFRLQGLQTHSKCGLLCFSLAAQVALLSPKAQCVCGENKVYLFHNSADTQWS